MLSNNPSLSKLKRSIFYPSAQIVLSFSETLTLFICKLSRFPIYLVAVQPLVKPIFTDKQMFGSLDITKLCLFCGKGEHKNSFACPFVLHLPWQLWPLSHIKGVRNRYIIYTYSMSIKNADTNMFGGQPAMVENRTLQIWGKFLR